MEMSKDLHLVRIKVDKKTKEEEFVPFVIRKEDIICLYRDRKGSFIVTKQGYTNKVPYNFEELEEYLGQQ
jgi:hypothetical protein